MPSHVFIFSGVHALSDPASLSLLHDMDLESVVLGKSQQ